jgi:3-mercaptopyruvate sulfurtransferase SseA
MRFILSMLTVLTLGLGVLTACQDAAPPLKIEASQPNANPTQSPATTTAVKTDEHGNQDDAPRITLADAKKDFDAGKTIFIDTRSADAYKLERIKGAINISVSDFEAKYKSIPKDKKIIVYCS